jgi:hypothetical protein
MDHMRLTRRSLTSALVGASLAALFVAGAPDPARAQPGCPLFSHITTSPLDPNHNTPTSVTVFGCSPCSEVVSSQIVSGTQVEVVLRHLESCTDTSSVWSATFDFGVLEAGSYNLVVTVRDEAAPEVGQVFGAYFAVAGDPPPPPPPPPPLPPNPSGPLFGGITTDPSPATSSTYTTVIVSGSYPYWCGFISDARILDLGHVELTLRQKMQCSPDMYGWTADSTWSIRLGLGGLPAGTHALRVTIRSAVGGDSLVAQDFDTSFEVSDTGPPAPPPPPPAPPVDSLSAPSPNPFADQTEVGLIAGEDTQVEVAIYDVAGRVVKDIFRGPIAAGTRTYAWDGRRNSGERARAGVYFYRVLQPGGRVWARRVVLLPGR